LHILKELKRRHVFRTAVAYLALAWLLIEVAGTLFPAFGIPDWVFRFIVVVLALGFAPALIISWVYEITPEGFKRDRDVARDEAGSYRTARRLDVLTMVAIGVALAFIALDRLWLSPMATGPSQLPAVTVPDPTQAADPELAEPQYASNSIAVLPFINMSEDPDNEYFSDGLSEELLNLLAKNPGLRVISRSSAFSYKGKNIKLAEIARELNVEHILEGSVRKSGNRVRITAQLIDARSDTHMWSETFDRTLDDIFAIQDEIALSVVRQLRGMLLGEEVPRANITDPQAYALFLQSRHLNSQFTKDATDRAEALLKQALSIDPTFAPAWTDLGGVYMRQEDYGLPVKKSRELAEAAFRQALSIDPGYAQAYASMSLLARANFDFASADQYLQQALQLDAGTADPLAAAASLMRTFGRFDGSIDLALKSISLDPVQASHYANLGYSCYYGGYLDKAASSFRKALSLAPQQFRAHFYLGRVMLARGEVQEALVEMQKESGEYFRLSGLAMASHALGDSDTSDHALGELIDKYGEVAAFQVAEVYAFRSEKDEAFGWLQKAYELEDRGLAVLLGDPVFSDLTDDPRYVAFLEQMGLRQYSQEMNK